MAAIVELKNVWFSAQNRVLARDVNFGYEEGKTTALVGPAGGGKSTMLKLSAGLLVPDRGEVCFRGKSISRMSRKENLDFRREGAVVFQDSALWANQNLFQILELPLRIHYPDLSRKEREQRIEAVISEVGYKKELGIRPAQLSMGEQKLLAFARALLCRPGLLYLDEWTESLDHSAAQRLVNLVKRRQTEGSTVIFVSHNFELVKDLADEIVMVLGGQVFLKITREQMDADEDLVRYVQRGIGT
ncbi:MAG: ATP-binding cassette domain-containing protein [Treponema sp.]|jgi:ABC-type transporter Mla maintaining outer membrane lipid asymmetry ATPase subunit MlaF|nr:ATP-binding cassette domain-containing protein [Treponema sp.]